MRKGIKPAVAGLCLGTLFLTGCNGEERRPKTTTEQSKSEDVSDTKNSEETEAVDAQIGMVEVCELAQLEEKEIISVSVTEDGKTIYLSTCYIDMESVMPVYEVLRYDYQEEYGSYAEPVKIEMDEGVSCIYFTVNQAENKAYMSVLVDNHEYENLEEVCSLHLATAQMEGNRLTNITLLEEIEELGNQIVSGVDEDETIYYITEDFESGMLVAKAAYMGEGYTVKELFQEGCVQTIDLETEESGQQRQSETEESGQQGQSETEESGQQGQSETEESGQQGQSETEESETEESGQQGQSETEKSGQQGRLEAEELEQQGQPKAEESQSDINTDEKVKDLEETKDQEIRNENTVLWEKIIDIRSIVKTEDGSYYFTAPGSENGIYMIYTTYKQENGLFSYPELLSKEINDGIEDKLYCTVSTDGKYLYYISSKSDINEKGEFYSKTMLYRVEREKLKQDYYE